MNGLNLSVSYKKGQANVIYSDDRFEQVMVVFHANTLVPLRDTLHFGLKPGHFMVYTKKWNEEGKWLVKDAGYVNYFRADQPNVIQTEYNTLSKQRLLSKGWLGVKETESGVILKSTSLFPLHRRVLELNTKVSRIIVEDYFIGSSKIFWNISGGLDVQERDWYNDYTLLY